MPVIIKSLLVNGEVGKTEINKAGAAKAPTNTFGSQQRILKLEEFTDQMIQILNDQKER